MSFEVERLPRQPEFLYRNVRCDGCDTPLQQVCAPERQREDGAWECLQPLDALKVHLVGGYGMVIDPLGENPHKFIKLFCKECVKKLCAQWPCIDAVVNPKPPYSDPAPKPLNPKTCCGTCSVQLDPMGDDFVIDENDQMFCRTCPRTKEGT